MQIRIKMKTPDAVADALNDIQDEDEQYRLKSLAHHWFEFGEYLTVEIDTEAKTCTVVPVKK